MKTIAISNQKGGVGKTTTAVNVSARLSNMGYQVLLIDLDAQGSATASYGYEPETLECTIADLFASLIDKESLNETLDKTLLRINDHLTLLPANLDLCPIETMMVSVISREHMLKKMITKIIENSQGKYEYIIMDCAPGLTNITMNAFTAANEVLIPIKAQYLDYKGFNQLYQNIMAVKEDLNPKLEIMGAFLTMYDGRLKLSKKIESAINQIQEDFQIKILETKISQCTKAAEAPLAGSDIFSFSPNSKTAQEYKSLVEEMLEVKDGREE